VEGRSGRVEDVIDACVDEGYIEYGVIVGFEERSEETVVVPISTLSWKDDEGEGEGEGRGDARCLPFGLGGIALAGVLGVCGGVVVLGWSLIWIRLSTTTLADFTTRSSLPSIGNSHIGIDTMSEGPMASEGGENVYRIRGPLREVD
jgi:hypothetical protein